MFTPSSTAQGLLQGEVTSREALVTVEAEKEIDMVDQLVLTANDENGPSKAALARARRRRRRRRRTQKKQEASEGKMMEVDEKNNPANAADEAMKYTGTRKTVVSKKERKEILETVSKKIVEEHPLLELLRNSAGPEGRAVFLDALAAVEPKATRMFDLIGALGQFASSNKLETLSAALSYRSQMKALRDIVVARERDTMLAQLKETLSPEEFAKRKKEMEEERKAGQLLFLAKEKAAGRMPDRLEGKSNQRRNHLLERREKYKKNRKQRREMAALNGLSNVLDNFTIDSGKALGPSVERIHA